MLTTRLFLRGRERDEPETQVSEGQVFSARAQRTAFYRILCVLEELPRRKTFFLLEGVVALTYWMWIFVWEACSRVWMRDMRTYKIYIHKDSGT